MSQQDYFILWSVYAIAAFVLLLASIFFTGFLWRFIKEPLVLIVAILLFYPLLIDPDKSQYAPAIAVMALDFFMHIGDHQAAIFHDLLYKIEIVLIVYFIFAFGIRLPIEYFFKRWRRSKKVNKQNQEHMQALDIEEPLRESSLRADERL